MGKLEDFEGGLFSSKIICLCCISVQWLQELVELVSVLQINESLD